MLFSSSEDEPSPVAANEVSPVPKRLGPPRRLPSPSSSSSAASPRSLPRPDAAGFGARHHHQPSPPSSSSSTAMLTPPSQRACHNGKPPYEAAVNQRRNISTRLAAAAPPRSTCTRAAAATSMDGSKRTGTTSSSVAASSAPSTSMPVDRPRFAAMLQMPHSCSTGLKSALSRLDEERAAGRQALAAAREREERLRLDLARQDAMAVAGEQQVRSHAFATRGNP